MTVFLIRFDYYDLAGLDQLPQGNLKTQEKRRNVCFKIIKDDMN